MTKAADTPDAAPAVGTEAALEQLLAEVQASATTPLALVKMQMALSDMQELNKLAADETTTERAQELAKAWFEGDDSLRKAFAGHWLARARGAVKGVENAGERVGRRAGDLYAGTRSGKRQLGAASGRARMQAESDQAVRMTPRSQRTPRVMEPGATVKEPRGPMLGAGTDAPRLRPGQQTQGAFEAKRAALRDKSISDAGRAAGRQAESGLRERFRQKGGQMGRKVARGGMAAGAGAAAGGAAYAGSSRWDSSKHNRGNRGQFSR